MKEAAATRARRGIAASAALGMLHVAGVAASSALLERVARTLPGFEASRLAQALSDATAEAGAEGAGGGPAWASLVLREAIVPATGEELLFRGVLFEVLRRAAGVRAAILGSALLFGLAHGDLHHGLVAGLLGVQLGCLRERHGLTAVWIAHAVNNTLVFAMPLTTAFSPACSDDRGLLGLGLALGLAGSSNAILLQVLCRGEGGGGLRSSAASGDAGA
jgi:membrane protease YdiL (CAAX protease family)